MLHLTINGRSVTAEPGDTIYMAAQKAGISIPSLCVSHQLAPFGSCRLCICEIDGQSGTPASCTTPVRPDMVVRTESDRLRRHRHNIVELYLSEQPEGSETSGPLRELALACGVNRVRYPDGAHRNAPLCATTRIRSLPSIMQPVFPARAVCGPAMKFKGRMP